MLVRDRYQETSKYQFRHLSKTIVHWFLTLVAPIAFAQTVVKNCGAVSADAA